MRAEIWWLVEDPEFKEKVSGEKPETLEVLGGPYFSWGDAVETKKAINTPAEVMKQILELEY